MPQDLTSAALAGLAATPKALSPKWLYDANGSAIFDEITHLREYDLPAREARVMSDVLPELATTHRGAGVAEFGIGSGDKSIALIEAIWPPVYVPLDISASALDTARDAMKARFAGLEIIPIAADFTAETALPDRFADLERRLGFFPGSTIGNFDDADAVRFLNASKTTLGPGSSFLIGADLVRDVDQMVAAYDDAEGVTARFNLNLLERLNREADGDFKLGMFRHEARWNAGLGRIEMHLVSALPQTVTVSGQRFSFAEGETIHTESSHKYTLEGFGALAEEGGWTVTRRWTDETESYGVFLLSA